MADICLYSILNTLHTTKLDTIFRRSYAYVVLKEQYNFMSAVSKEKLAGLLKKRNGSFERYFFLHNMFI